MEAVDNNGKTVGGEANPGIVGTVWFPCGRGRPRIKDVNNNIGWKNQNQNSIADQAILQSQNQSCRTSPPPSGSSSGPGVGDAMSVEQCSFCARPPRNIICRACGHTFRGRVRVMCSHHPTIIHLMDIEACISCKAYQLREFPDMN